MRLDLFGLGALPGLLHAFVAQSLTAGAGLGRHGAFDIILGRIASARSLDGRLVVMEGDEPQALAALREDLARALVKAGLRKFIPPAWTPRVTLAACVVAVPTLPVPPIRWRVEELVLFRLLLGGTRRIVLGRWSLEPVGETFA